MTVGPSSVGYRLTTEALCFGGQQCTTTDVAIAAGVAPRTICTTEGALASLQPAMVYATMREIRRKVEAIIDSMKVSRQCSVYFHCNTHMSWLQFLFCFVFLHNILCHIGTIAMSIYVSDLLYTVYFFLCYSLSGPSKDSLLLVSFPGPAQLSVTFSTVKRERAWYLFSHE